MVTGKLIVGNAEDEIEGAVVGNDDGFMGVDGNIDEEAVGSVLGGVLFVMVGTIVSGLIDGT